MAVKYYTKLIQSRSMGDLDISIQAWLNHEPATLNIVSTSITSPNWSGDRLNYHALIIYFYDAT